MKFNTRKKFDAYTARVAALSGVSIAAVLFAVEPSVSQTMETRITDSSDFLKSINVVPVDEIKGDKIGLGISRTIAGRTNTNTTDRAPTELHDLTSNQYECKKTEFDWSVKYSTLDSWAKFEDFETRLRNAVLKQMGLDRIMIGWNGTSAATQSNRGSNPLLQDVNIGWLQHIRDDAPEQHLNAVKVGTGPASPDYKNLDAAVLDAVELLHETVRDNPDLVVICNRTLLSDEYVTLAGEQTAPTEKMAFHKMLSNKKVGGLPVVEVPYFPAKAFLITTLDNLSIYYQDGSRRRKIDDNAKRDQIEDYNTVNEAYVVEEYQAAAFVDGILVPDSAGTAWE